MPIIDRYDLEPSNLITIEGHDEERVSLALQPSPLADVGVVQGIVQQTNGTAIPLATVQLFDSAGNPFEHTNTNPTGRFVFQNIPVGAYFVTAFEPGFLTPTRISVSVTRAQPANVTINMQPDPNFTRGAVYGIIRSSSLNSEVIEHANVELYRVAGGVETFVGRVVSNATGQYLFADLESGTYILRVSNTGYLSNDSAPVTITGREFAALDVIISADPDANTGTISGIITDQTTGLTIPNAIVALYRINGGTETLIEITRTNAGGLYLFGDIPPDTYRVKATVQEVI